MIQTYIPFGDVPKTPYAGIQSVYWLGVDNPDNYEKGGNHEFTEGEVLYNFNSYGYRSDEWVDRKEINVLTVGCSVAFGLGLNREDTYPDIFCRSLSRNLDKSVGNWNLSWPGKSNDYISRIILSAVPFLRPNFVLIGFTAIGRREFVDIEGKCLDYLPGSSSRQDAPILERALCRNLDALTSPFQDLINFYRNYKLVELLLNLLEVQWIYSVLVPRQIGPVKQYINHERLIAGSPSKKDRARDGLHPGIVSHQDFANYVFSAYHHIQTESNE